MRVAVVFGTRPEAIKMAPVVRALQAAPGVAVDVVTTGQHREMLDQVNALFGIVPDHDLNLMTAGQTLTHVTVETLRGLEAWLAAHRPDWLLVQGDTTSAFAAALAGFYAGVPVAHVEAGLRTGDLANPWPEEMNRRLVSPLAALHFAPTARARANLLREGVAEAAVLVTGNTVVDALLWVRERLAGDPALAARAAAGLPALDPGRRLILTTSHRRENWDGGIARVCGALRDLVAARPDTELVFPVHLNPTVRAAAAAALGGAPRVHLVPPQDYLPFVWLMARAALIVTDSGGVQEEAPSLGVPVLVTRETTERPEAVEAGTVRLVGTAAACLLAEAGRLLDDPAAHAVMARAHNPYGDGLAAGRIVARLLGGPAPGGA